MEGREVSEYQSSFGLNDETFLAIEELNSPGVLEATRSGKNMCACARCMAVREALGRQAKPQLAEADTGRGSKLDDPVVVEDKPDPRPWDRRPGAINIIGNQDDFDAYTKVVQERLAEADLRQDRKNVPIASGVLAYFPKAIAAVAQVSKIGNDQHNPGEPLRWAREKSPDEADALTRHLIDYLRGGDRDTDTVFHLAKVAWRALALLERFLDGEEPGR